MKHVEEKRGLIVLKQQNNETYMDVNNCSLYFFSWGAVLTAVNHCNEVSILSVSHWEEKGEWYDASEAFQGVWSKLLEPSDFKYRITPGINANTHNFEQWDCLVQQCLGHHVPSLAPHVVWCFTLDTDVGMCSCKLRNKESGRCCSWSLNYLHFVDETEHLLFCFIK